MHDLRLALRSLLKTPGFTAIAVLTLALGIGVNTSMFTVLNTILLHEPPYPGTDALIRVFRTGPTFQFAPHSPANFLDLRAQARSFDGFAAFASGNVNFNEPDRPAEQLRGMTVTGDFFAILGVSPALGRFLNAEDDRTGHDKVVVLSDPFWRRLGGDPTIVGRQIRADGELVTVVGVMPAGFDDPLVWGDVAVWRPMAFDDETRANRGGNWLGLIGRLKPGVTSEQALADLSAINTALAAAYPETNAQTGFNLVPFVQSMQDSVARTMSLFVMGLAGCVLLIACVNLANLLFARNVLRAREYAIRTALGASRLKLLRQSLAESLWLALIGGLLGLLLAAWINPLLGSQISIAGREGGLELALDPRVIGFSLAASMASAVGFGLLPALLVSRTNVNHALKQGARGSTSAAHHRIRHALIVIEVALALVLLSGAGFFLRGLDRFLTRDHGWRTTGLLTADISLPRVKYGNDEALVAYYERLESRLAALPGVERVSLSRTLPFYGFGWGQRFIVEGQALPEPGREPMRDVNGVSPGYFETMGITLLEGRGFSPADLHGPVKTVISESMARNLWPGESAIGKRIAHPVRKEWQEVVGVVREVQFASNLDRTGGRFQTYRLFAREPDGEFTVALRCLVPPDTLAGALRQAVAGLDPEVPVSNIRPADLVVEQNLSNYALAGRMLTGFALLGLLLASVGIYGVISGYVAQRTGEIGIRMALGAQWRDVIRLVLGQGLRLTLIGAILGLLGAWGVARLLKSAVPALPASEPILAAGVLLLLLATTLLACWLPARRATKVDPLVALRAE